MFEATDLSRKSLRPFLSISLDENGVNVTTGQAKRNHSIRKIWHWLQSQFVQTVPDDVALCEFDCQKLQCTMGEWETCDRRIRNAAGELMPIIKKAPPPQK